MNSPPCRQRNGSVFLVPYEEMLSSFASTRLRQNKESLSIAVQIRRRNPHTSFRVQMFDNQHLIMKSSGNIHMQNRPVLPSFWSTHNFGWMDRRHLRTVVAKATTLFHLPALAGPIKQRMATIFMAVARWLASGTP